MVKKILYSDKVLDVKPKIKKADNPEFVGPNKRTLGAGMPMGLLLALTYSTTTEVIA